MYPIIQLKKGREQSLLRKHPWVFSGGIDKVTGIVQEGSEVELRDVHGNFCAYGHYYNGSIAVRIISFDSAQNCKQAIKYSILKAFNYRKRIGMVGGEHTNIYRLVHGEGDSLSGLVIDIYGNTAVVQCHTTGMINSLDSIQETLKELYSSKLNIYLKSKDLLADTENQYLHGQFEEEVLKENGLRFEIDWQKGQKTGFFIDQRTNRKLLQNYVREKKVLNLFSYTGGFSVYAQAAGASHVTSVDASASANELCRKNFQLNFQIEHEALTRDAVEYVKDMGMDYDVIILDPPAFAKHLSAKHKAVMAYKRLNANTLKHIKKGGILFTFSCSQVVDASTFKDTITAAAIESGRSIRIMHQLSQPEDHPINIFHPESNYLKGLVLFIED